VISEVVSGGEAMAGFKRYVKVGKRVVAVEAPYASRRAIISHSSSRRHTINPLIIYSSASVSTREMRRYIPFHNPQAPIIQHGI
jgi:hypothetical protein